MAKMAIYDRERYRGNALLKHPYRKWFDEKIFQGYRATEIYRMHLQEIPELEHHVSAGTIRGYMKNILKPNAEILKEAERSRENIEKALEEQAIHKQLVEENKELIVAQAQNVIEADKTFISLHNDLNFVRERLKERMQNPDMKDTTFMQGVIAISELADKIKGVLTDYLKVTGKYQDAPTTQINIVQIEQHNQELKLLKSLVIDIMKEIEPDKVPLFIQMYREGKERIKTQLAAEAKLVDTVQMSEDQAQKIVEAKVTSLEKLGTTSINTISEHVPEFDD